MKQFMMNIREQITRRVDDLVMILQGWKKCIIHKYHSVKDYIQTLRNDWHLFRTMKAERLELLRVDLNYSERYHVDPYPHQIMQLEFYATSEIGKAVWDGRIGEIYILVPKS